MPAEEPGHAAHDWTAGLHTQRQHALSSKTGTLNHREMNARQLGC
jgi:hypothetical protein